MGTIAHGLSASPTVADILPGLSKIRLVPGQNLHLKFDMLTIGIDGYRYWWHKRAKFVPVFAASYILCLDYREDSLRHSQRVY